MWDRQNSITEVVANGLCTGCGTCVLCCPNDAITMKETPAGLLLARVAEERCTCCGTCQSVCPGWHLEPCVLRRDVDPLKGEILGAYVGKATNRELLLGAQSGGVVTTLLDYLLKSRKIDLALVTKIPNNGTLRPTSIVTCDQREIWEARGSKYCPVPLNASIKSSPRGARLAVVGLPCHIHGLRNAQALRLNLGVEIKMTIGLMCDRILTYRAIDYLIKQSKRSIDEVKGFEYRSKKWRGWPGDTLIRTFDGMEYYVPRRERLLVKNTFTPLCCRLCFDKFNVFSDITVGDPWGFSEEKDGSSIVLCRTENGLNILSSAKKNGFVELNTVSSEDVLRRRHLERRRRDWSNYIRIWDKMGKIVPDFSIDKKWYAKIENVNVRPYLRALRWPLYLASLKKREEVKRAIKWHILGIKLSRLPLIKSVRKRVRRFI